MQPTTHSYWFRLCRTLPFALITLTLALTLLGCSPSATEEPTQSQANRSEQEVVGRPSTRSPSGESGVSRAAYLERTRRARSKAVKKKSSSQELRSTRHPGQLLYEGLLTNMPRRLSERHDVIMEMSPGTEHVRVYGEPSDS